MFLREHVLMQEAGGAGGEAGGGEAGGEAGGGADWFTALPDDIRAHESVANFAGKGVEDLARQRVSDHGFISRSIRIPDENAPEDVRAAFTEKLTGIDGVVRLPNDESSDEDRATFYAKLGRPEGADKYDFTMPEDIKLPEGVSYEGGELEAWFRQNAFDQGLSQKQAGNQWEGYVRAQAEILNKAAATQAESVAELKQKWGPDRFDANMGAATACIEQLAKSTLGEKAGDFIAELERTGLGNLPGMAEIFHEVSKHLLEDSALRDLAAGGSEPAGLAAIEEQIAELQGSEAYADGKHNDHRRVVEKINSLWKARNVITGEA